MRYLLSVIRCADEMLKSFKPWREAVIMDEAIDTEARIDWRAVVIHCMPHVVVVLNHDKTGKVFHDYPLYAILPESEQVVSLKGEIVLSVKESDDVKAEVDVHGALNSLLTYAQSIDGGKRENAMRQLRILQRILR